MTPYNWRRLALALSLTVIVALTACRRTPATTPPAPPTAAVQAIVETPTTAATLAPTATAILAPTPVPTTTPQPTPDIEPIFEEAPCAFEEPEEVDVRCGYLVVPQDRNDPTGSGEVRLHVALFAAEGANPQSDPIVYLEGGPGGDALEGIPYIFEERFAPFLAERDLIMFDQRGTGYSQPSLDCPEYRELALEMLDQILPPEEDEQLFLEVMSACRQRLLAEGVVLDAYNSAASAADLDDLRRALGYEQWNLLGISYGTRLALTAMRDYPEGIRSVILDSTYPPQVNIVTETPGNLARAMDALFSACAADAACDEAYPNLRAFFFDLVARTNAEPISAPVYHALNGERYEARLAGDDLLGLLFQGLYSEEIIPLLPQFIYETAAGDYDILSALLSNNIVNDEFFSIGMNFSVQCQEELPFTTPQEARLAVAAYPELEPYFQTSATSGQTAFAICGLWDVAPAQPVENEAVAANIATLIMAGEYDPITPPSWGELAQQALPNSFFVSFPALGHGVSLAGDCPRQIVDAFLADPQQEPDTGCVAQMSAPAFLTPGSMPAVVMEPFTIDLLGAELSGLAPAGWEEVSTGIFARQLTVLDQTALLQQAAPGISASQFLDVLTRQLNLDERPQLAATQQASGRSWNIYGAETQGALVDIALAEDGGITYMVLLFSHRDERDTLYNTALLPALAAIRVDV